MNYNECQALLSAIQGCTFAGLDTETIPVLKGGKSNPFQGKVKKLCLGHRVLLFTNKNGSGYLNKVKRHLEREGKNPDSFVMGPLPWGERLPNSPFIHHKGEHYLQACFMASGSVRYSATHEIDCPGFLVLPGEELEDFEIPGLPDRTGSEHQNLEQQVIIRTYKISSILAIRAFNEELI